MQTLSLARAAAILRAGGCVIYPTETYFALGALADNAAALERIVVLKGRPSHKPLPLLVGDLAQLGEVVPPGFAAGPLGADFSELAALFWPGPLSLVVPCRKDLPGLVKDAAGRVSVRFTPHETAAALCRLAGGPLVATSANVSGGAPAATPEELDPEVTAAVDAVLSAGAAPAGGPASTVAGLDGGKRLTIFRQGATPLAALEQAGFLPLPFAG
jgi:L-threonylcarbamoyladenylate synthase